MSVSKLKHMSEESRRLNVPTGAGRPRSVTVAEKAVILVLVIAHGIEMRLTLVL